MTIAAALLRPATRGRDSGSRQVCKSMPPCVTACSRSPSRVATTPSVIWAPVRRMGTLSRPSRELASRRSRHNAPLDAAPWSPPWGEGLGGERPRCRLVEVSYRSAVRTLDAVFIVSAGVVAALEVALGVATLARSHHQQGANLSRGRRIVVPWLATCVYLFLALVFATLALQGDVEPGSDGNELLHLAGDVFAVAGIVTSLAWFVIRVLWRGRTAQHPTSS